MAKKLNRISDEDVRSEIDFIRKRIERDEKSGASPVRQWYKYLELGCFLYQEDAPNDEVRACFVRAANDGVVACARRQRRSEGGDHRTPWSFALLLGAAAAFGSEESRRNAGAIERWKWLDPEQPEYVLMAASLEQLQAFFGGRFEVGAADEVIRRCSAENADRDAVRFDGQLVRGLVAIQQHDAAVLNTAIETMVSEHQHRALRGHLRTQADGLVALLPLGLVRLGRDAGLHVAVDSPYVPVDLL